ncbi:MAG: hypothetical protein JRI93_04140 [Deltaproteobacteria bacterium]|nr:hypothetical protein [Deltaproteobacteria bacterium]MBW2611783.1 hypothetical protein [Deltaproteobacteria bacterium]MBW2632949.1 hypothetical protein [Deltaproteobacteria bacterium]MBW2677271.1 hypothetical protein [Deltaproteobacteria bacterium]
MGNMPETIAPDIRDRKTITHEDVLGLNFIRKPSKFYFRGHFREGLRSRIIQILDPRDVRIETRGVMREGIRRYPLARPLRMLRIFRRPVAALNDLKDEILNYQILQEHLPAAYFAASSEFLVDYEKPGGREIVLCGLQKFVDGESLDPWNPRILESVKAYYRTRAPREHTDPEAFAARKVNVLQQHTQAVIRHLKNMAHKTRRIPDLAGIGNILFTLSATIHLVDINNISRISVDSAIPIDDKGYPACDKSIEALALLERGVLGRPVDSQEELYRIFLNPERMRRVRKIEKKFHARIARGDYPSPEKTGLTTNA